MLLRNLGLPDSSRRNDAAATLAGFLTDPQLLRELLATAPQPTLARLRELSMGGRDDEGYYHRSQQDQEGEIWARRRGLLFGGQYYSPEVPVEVALAVRTISVSFHPDPPALAVQSVAGFASPASLSDAAAAAAADFTETVAGLLDSLSRSPLPALKAGGIGTREVARVAKMLGVPDGLVRLALELIRALGLLAGAGGGVTGGVHTAPAGVTWRADEPSTRFADLAVAWWGLPVTPSLTHDPDGKAIPAIGGRSADGAAMAAALGRAGRGRCVAAGRRVGLDRLPGRAPQLVAAGISRAAGPGGRRDLEGGPHPRDRCPGGHHPARRCPAGAQPRCAAGRRRLTVVPRDQCRQVRFGLDRDGRRVAVGGGEFAARLLRRPGKPGGGDRLAVLPGQCAAGVGRGRWCRSAGRCTFRDRGGRSPAALDVPDRRCAAQARNPGRPRRAELRALGRRGIADRGRRPPQPPHAASFAAGADGAGLPGRARRRPRRLACRGVHAGSGTGCRVHRRRGHRTRPARCRPVPR